MTEYVTVFQSTPPDFSWFGPMVAAILLGLAVIVVAAAIVKLHPSAGFLQPPLVGGIALVTIATAFAFAHHTRPRLAVVEGIVTDFQPTPYWERGAECFKVADQRFCYFDHTIGSAFHHTVSHGGPVRPEQPVRVTYLGDSIYRLEIAKGFVPSSGSRAVVAALAKQKHMAAIRNSAVDQGFYIGFLTFALVATGSMSWWWRPIYLLSFPDPDCPLTPVLFRLFVGLSFFGAAWRLTEQLLKQPPTIESAAAGLFVFTLVGSFLAFNVWHALKFRRLRNK